MSIKLISLKCPDCGYQLSVESGRSQFFCSYCGAKILVSNNNEFIVRHVDEAEIKRAETERIVELQRLQAEKKESNSIAKKIGGILLILLGGGTVFLFYELLFVVFALGSFGTVESIVYVLTAIVGLLCIGLFYSGVKLLTNKVKKQK